MKTFKLLLIGALGLGLALPQSFAATPVKSEKTVKSSVVTKKISPKSQTKTSLKIETKPSIKTPAVKNVPIPKSAPKPVLKITPIAPTQKSDVQLLKSIKKDEGIEVSYESLSFSSCYIGACFNGVIVAPGAKKVELLWAYDDGGGVPVNEWTVQPTTPTTVGYDPTIGQMGKEAHQFVTWIPASMMMYGNVKGISYATRVDGVISPIQYMAK